METKQERKARKQLEINKKNQEKLIMIEKENQRLKKIKLKTKIIKKENNQHPIASFNNIKFNKNIYLMAGENFYEKVE